MKKIIAAAVAGAFVVPAVHAAEVTIGGEIEFVYESLDDAAGSNTEKLVDNGNLITVTATEEVDGITITAGVSMGLDGETGDQTVAGEMFVDGQYISLAGAFGKVTVGDTSGALDNYGDYTDVAPYALGFAGDGSDHAIRYDLPATIPGLSVSASMTPENGAFVSGDDEIGASDDTDERDNGVTADATGFGVAYDIAGGQIYYGQQDDATTDTTAYGIKYSMNGIYVAYESGKKKQSATADIDYQGQAVTYSMNNIKFIYEAQKTTQSGAATADDSAFAVEYNLGSNVDLWAEQRDDKFNSDTYTYVGVEYNF